MYYMHIGQEDGSTSINARFGEAVRRSREALEWTQGDLANRLSKVLGKPVAQSTVARLEKGSRPTPLNEVFALAAVLGVSVQSLLPSPDPFDELLRPLDLMSSNLSSELMKVWDRSAAVQRELEEVAEARENMSLVKEMMIGSKAPDRELIEQALVEFTRVAHHREPHYFEKLVSVLGLPLSVAEELSEEHHRMEGIAEYYEQKLNWRRVYEESARTVAARLYEKLAASTGESNDDSSS